eukprot:2807581-Pyramimonas_sp.AAC.1
MRAVAPAPCTYRDDRLTLASLPRSTSTMLRALAVANPISWTCAYPLAPPPPPPPAPPPPRPQLLNMKILSLFP